MAHASTTTPAPKPFKAAKITGVLVLADGTVFEGQGFGRTGTAVGEVCFNTSMTGYQEIMTDPSYAGQIVTFTFPHVGNVGTNANDHERGTSAARGMVLRDDITLPASYRSEMALEDWAEGMDLVGLAGIDTRALTQIIRATGAPTGVVAFNPAGEFDIAALKAEAQAWPGLKGMDLAKDVTRDDEGQWNITRWRDGSYGQLTDDSAPRVVAVDYGAKDNILRCLADTGLAVTVVPADISAEDLLAIKADGYFLSNGPGDPAATLEYARPAIDAMINTGKPIFGICLGHQLLALAMGAQTYKMTQGHRGANHPVKDLESGKVEITSMNHGFAVSEDGLPGDVLVTQKSLFDGSVCGIKHTSKPIFSVQQHPEASPGPMDSLYLFDRFRGMVTC